MIVAINKIDKPEADQEKVKRELAKQDVLVESMGGNIPSVNVSAKTGQGIPELLEIILLVAEMENLKGEISKPAEGVIIESYLDANRGPTATLLLKDGTLKKGEILGTSSALGKIKIMEDFQGNPIEEAFPSTPVVIIGFEKVPGVGEKFKVFENAEKARENIEKEVKAAPEAFNIEPSAKVLNLILKVDVAGPLEAIEEVLKELSSPLSPATAKGAELADEPDNAAQEKAILRILKAEVGEINESDVKLAIAAKAKIIGFRVKINPIAKNLAQREKITTINFEVIYELAQAVRNLLEKKIVPKEVRVDLGEIKILSIFRTEKNRQIVGGKLIKGEARQGALLEIHRGEEKIGAGKIIELQKDKKKIKQITEKCECGVLYEGEKKIEEGDILKIYAKEMKKGGI
jgi:translation initiation factor IF-2